MRGQEGRPTTDQVMDGRFEDEPEQGRAAIVPHTPERAAMVRPQAPQPTQGPAAQMTPAMTSAETDVLFRELALAQLKFGEVVKTRTATIRANFSYKFANLSDVCAAVMPALKEHGIVPIQVPRVNRVVVRLVHGPSGQWIEGALPLVLPDHGADVQRLGSAITYVRRYLLCTMLGIVAADEDDDGAAANARPTMGTRRQEREPGDDG